MANSLPPLDTDYNYAGAFTQGAAQGMQLKNALTASREQEEMKNALRQMPSGPDGAPDLDAVTNKMLQMGNIEGAAKVAAIKTALGKGDIDTRLKQLDYGSKMLDLGFKTLQNSTYESYPSDYARLTSVDPIFAKRLPHPNNITDPTDFGDMKRYMLTQGMDLYKQIQLERGKLTTPFAADINGEPGYATYDKDAKKIIPIGAEGTPPPRWRTQVGQQGAPVPTDQRPRGFAPAPGSGIKISNLQMGPGGISLTLKQPGAQPAPAAAPATQPVATPVSSPSPITASEEESPTSHTPAPVGAVPASGVVPIIPEPDAPTRGIVIVDDGMGNLVAVDRESGKKNPIAPSVADGLLQSGGAKRGKLTPQGIVVEGAQTPNALATPVSAPTPTPAPTLPQTGQGQVITPPKKAADQPTKPPFEVQAEIDAAAATKGRSLTPDEIRDITRGVKNKGDIAQYMVENPDANLTGEAALSNFKPEVQVMAKKIVRAEVPYPSNFALKDPFWKASVLAAEYIDPGYNASNYPTRLSTQRSFTSGRDRRNITSINTLVGHLASLEKSANALDNSSFQLWNRAANAGITAFGDERVTKFNMDLGAVESELATIFKQTGATDQEIKAWRDRISSSQSPKQLKTAIKEAVELMGSRLAALKDSYKAGMGPIGDIQILSPKSRKTLETLVGRDAVAELEPEGKSPDLTEPMQIDSASTLSNDDLLKRLTGGK